METVCCNSKVHESPQFMVIPIFLGKAGRFIYYLWIIIIYVIVLRILKKSTTKTAKNEKMPQNSQFWACFGIFE